MKMPKLTKLLLLAAAFGALTASLHAEESKYFMKMPGIEGSSTFNPGPSFNYTNWMEVEGFYFGNYRNLPPVSDGGVASGVTAEASTVSVYMTIDPKAFGGLFISSVNGNFIGNAAKDGDFLIENVTLGAAPKRRVQVSLNGAIQSLNIEGSTGDQMFVHLEIQVRKIYITTYKYNPDGGANGNHVAGWDFQNSTPL